MHVYCLWKEKKNIARTTVKFMKMSWCHFVKSFEGGCNGEGLSLIHI